MKTNYDLLTEDQKKAMIVNDWGIGKDSNDVIFGCDDCRKCMFDFKTSCYISREKWLNTPVIEYQIPKDTPIDTKVLVSHSGEYWNRRYFAGKFSEDGKALCFGSGATSWSIGSGSTYMWEHCKLARLGEEE